MRVYVGRGGMGVGGGGMRCVGRREEHIATKSFRTSQGRGHIPHPPLWFLCPSQPPPPPPPIPFIQSWIRHCLEPASEGQLGGGGRGGGGGDQSDRRVGHWWPNPSTGTLTSRHTWTYPPPPPPPPPEDTGYMMGLTLWQIENFYPKDGK